MLNSASSSSVDLSEIATTTSVFITLWMIGMCLSPMPWMLCSPKPFSSIVGHSSASTATIFVPYSSFRRSPAAIVPADPVAEVNAARLQVAALPLELVADRFEDVAERPTGHLVVAEVVAELGELVEHEVAGVEGQLVAGVVDLLDVRLGAVGADDVLGRVRAPLVEPVEALLAHALGEDRHAAAGHDPADGDAAAGVVAGRRPDRAVVGRVELAGDDPRREAGVGGEHLVGGDHREPVAEHDDDRALDTGEARRQHDVVGHVDPVAGEVVVPVDPPQVAGVGALRVGVADLGGVVERRRVLELGERRQRDALRAEALDAVGERGLVDDPVGEPELVLQRLRGGVDEIGRCSHLDILSKARGDVLAATRSLVHPTLSAGAAPRAYIAHRRRQGCDPAPEVETNGPVRRDVTGIF